MDRALTIRGEVSLGEGVFTRAFAVGAGGAFLGCPGLDVMVDATLFLHVGEDKVFSAGGRGGLAPGDDIEGRADQLFYGGVAVTAEGALNPVGDDSAETEAMVAEQLSEAIDTRCFHLEIGDAVGTVGEVGEAVDEFGLGEAEAQYAALRAIKTGAGDGDAMVEAGGEMPQQGGAGAADIGLSEAVVQLGLGSEGMEQLALVFAGLVAVEIQEVVDAEAMGGRHKAVDGDIFLEGAAGSHTDDGEGGEGSFDGAGGKVDIGEGVELVEHDVDIVRADAGGDYGEAFLADAAGVGNEFPVVGAVFDSVEVFANVVDAVRIAYGEDGGGEFFGTEVEVVDGATVIDN